MSPTTPSVRCDALSAPRASLVGRDADVSTLERLLREPGALVTLWGPPGVGKSCLSCELVRRAGAAAVFVPLGGASDEPSLTAALCAVLGVAAPSSGRLDDLATALVDLIAPGALLVLDGAEGAAEVLSTRLPALFAAVPTARWLVTSREPLGAAGERVAPLGPLDLASATRLLRERAENLSFEAGAGDDSLLAAIASAVDGLPLALELAAPRVARLGPATVLDALARSVLSLDGRRSERTLTAAIEESWRLTPEPQRVAFARLSVLRGPFDEEAARAIAALDAVDALDTLDDLTRRALLVARLDAGRARFSMLSPLRAYALQVAARSEVLADARDAHGRYFASLARRGLADLDGPAPGAALLALRRARENLTAALEAPAARDRVDVLSALEPLYEIDGPMGVFASVCERVAATLQDSDGAPHRIRVDALRAEALRRAARVDEAARVAEETAACAVEAGDAGAASRAYETSAYIALLRGDGEVATGLAASALSAAATIGDWGLLRRAHFVVANVWLRRGAHGEAAAAIDRALDEAERRGSRREVCRFALMLGSALVDVGRASEAAAQFERAQQIVGELHDLLLSTNVAVGVAMVAHRRGDLDEALARYREASALATALGASRLAAVHAGYAALVLLERSAWGEARALLPGIIERVKAHRDLRDVAMFSAALGACEAALGEVEPALARADHALLIAEKVEGALAPTLYLRAYVLEQQALEASARGDRDGAAALRRAWRECVERADGLCIEAPGGPRTTVEACVTARFFERARGAPAAPSLVAAGALRVGAGAAWVQPPGQSAIDLRRKPVLRALVAALVAARAQGPDVRVSREALQRAGWGDERIPTAVAGNRIRVALTTLRELGLRDAIHHDAGGWWLAVPCVEAG